MLSRGNQQPLPSFWERLLAAWRDRRLRKARERYAYWKGRREVLERNYGNTNDAFRTDKTATANAKEAKYLERVEHYLRHE